MPLALDRPLAIFDLETTGTDPGTDKIVEISVLRIEPDGTRQQRTRLIHPERPIPAAAAAVHGITDEKVVSEPPFRQVARSLLDFLAGCDLGGFNVERFDLPLLEREMKECGLELDVRERRIVDVMRIFHRKEPRDLTAALAFYLGREHTGAHGAEADVLATYEVLEAQVERYEDVPADVGGLVDWLNPRRADAIDRDGKFLWEEGEAVFGFGKHRGKRLRDVAEAHRDYLRWVLKTDFPADAKGVVSDALEGRFPQSPPAPDAAPSADAAQST